MSENRSYTDPEKRAAVRAVLTQGGFRQAGAMTGIPWETIAGWKHRDPEWWDQLAAELNLELMAGLEDIHQRSRLRIQGKLLGALEDRIDNGEVKINVKTGELIRTPMLSDSITKALPVVGGLAKGAPKESPVKLMTDEERIQEFVKIAEADRASRPKDN